MITDEYGYEYHPIEGFDLRADVNFDLEALKSVISDGEPCKVNFVYPLNPDADVNGRSKTLVYGEDSPSAGQPRYVGMRLHDSAPIGYRIIECDDFTYEGGMIQGFGTFKVLDSGNLGDGHEAWCLLTHVESGRFIRIGGYYSSWDSGEMDEYEEVEEVTVSVLRYKPVGQPDATVYENPTR